MARSRAYRRLFFALTVLCYGLSLGARPPASVSAAPLRIALPAAPRTPLLAMPRAMLRSPAVPVIVEMNSPAPVGPMGRSPELQNLLSRAQGSLLGVLHASRARDVYAFRHIPAVAATVSGADLPRLLAQPGVGAIVLDRWISLPPLPDSINLRALTAITGTTPVSGAINAPPTNEPESFSLTRADVAQRNGYNGAGVRVAIVDSGLDLAVPDLAGTVATDAHGVPLRVDFTGTDLQDTIGHGTACASMIAAQGRSMYTSDTLSTVLSHTPGQIYSAAGSQTPVYRSHFRVYGMAPGVQLMSAKIFDRRAPHGGGYDSWIVRAIEWAIDHHANVISESFGGLSVPSNGTDPIALADEAAIAAGITVVAADGNDGPGQSTISSPANAPGVIAVGASTQYRNFGQTGFLAPFGLTTNDNIASFTSRGPTTDGRPRPDLVAPGAFSWALFPLTRSDDGPTSPPYDIGTFGGTSQATPVTAGAAALVIDAFRKAHHGVSPSPALVRTILMSSAHDLGYPAFDQGAGRLDAWEAVRTAVHSGPSFLVNPSSVAAAGPVAAPVAATFAITNTGSNVQTYTFDAVHSRLTGIEEWGGTIVGPALDVFHFTVIPGLERVVGAVYWSSADRFMVQGTSMAVAMRVSLYDPLGRFVNYSYGVGSGYASAQASHPMPGVWSLVVTENGRKDGEGLRHFASEPFQARIQTFATEPYGTITPSAVTLAPGHAAHITLAVHMPAHAGTEVMTVHIHGDHTAALPVALTSYITLTGAHSTFSGVFTGPSTDYFSFANENKVYSLNVPAGTRLLNVFLTWPDSGYGVIALLMDPSGEVVDGQFNGISNGNASGPFDLSARNLEMLWSNPVPGRWQIIVMDAIFAGAQRAEDFTGQVVLNDTPVLPLSVTRTALPGSNVSIDLRVTNNNGPNVAEGYIGYATSTGYGNIPMGTVSGPFGNPVNIAGSDIYTYTTGFVPPGTRMLVSSVAVIHPTVTADLAFADPIGFARAQGLSLPVVIGGHTYQQGTQAIVTGPELPIGSWYAEVTLRRPFNTHTRASVVAASYANALTPLSWVTFDHGLDNGRITGGQPLILLPGEQGTLHASVSVPLDMKPGAYHAHLFVISVFADQVADLPFTLIVQAHTGAEPVTGHP